MFFKNYAEALFIVLKGQVRPIETLVLLIVLISKNTMLFTGT